MSPLRYSCQRGSMASSLLFLVLLASTVWLVTLILGLANGLMACAGLLLVWSLFRVWQLILLASVLGATAWLMTHGSPLLSFLF